MVKTEIYYYNGYDVFCTTIGTDDTIRLDVKDIKKRLTPEQLRSFEAYNHILIDGRNQKLAGWIKTQRREDEYYREKKMKSWRKSLKNL